MMEIVLIQIRAEQLFINRVSRYVPPPETLGDVRLGVYNYGS